MTNEYDRIIDQLIYSRHAMSTGTLLKKFTELSTSQYLALRVISHADSNSIYEGRTYIKDLADEMNLSIRKTSKTVRSLRDKGLVMWGHDGDGTEGTYTFVTEDGAAFIRDREEQVKEYFTNVIDKFGIEDMKTLIKMLKELETVMNGELEEDDEEDFDVEI